MDIQLSDSVKKKLANGAIYCIDENICATRYQKRSLIFFSCYMRKSTFEIAGEDRLLS